MKGGGGIRLQSLRDLPLSLSDPRRERGLSSLKINVVGLE